MIRHLTAGLVFVHAASALAVNAQALSIVPTFGTSVLYDSNVFQRPYAEGDVAIRFSPRLDARRDTERLALAGTFELDSERFAAHQRLTTARARDAASFDLQYAASPRLSLTAAVAFTETDTPAELNELTALTPGRVRARRLMLHPAATYDLGSRSQGTVGYLVTEDSLHGGVSVTTSTLSADIERHVSPRDSSRFEYLEQRFLFGTGESSASRAFTAEWSREIERNTTLMFRAGPRITSGVFAPELMASARRAIREGSLSVSYQQTQTTLIGLVGVARMRSLLGRVEREIGPRIALRGTSGVVQTRQADLLSLAYHVSGACDWQLAARMRLEAGYEANLQHGHFYAVQPAQTIRRNVMTVQVIVADPRAATSGR